VGPGASLAHHLEPTVGLGAFISARTIGNDRDGTMIAIDDEVDPMFRGGLQGWHIIVVAVVLIVLFGAKRMPDAARALGRSMRILKAETRGLADDDVAAKAEAQSGRQPLSPLEKTERPAPQPSAAEPVERLRDN
jgi:sec-independent protein translocase protein TatA